MVLGRSCSERGRSASSGDEEEEGVTSGACLETRLYFVLLGLASAWSSAKKALSSLSANSSRVTGAGSEEVGGIDCSGMGFEETLLSAGAEADGVDDQSQPILNVVVDTRTRLWWLCKERSDGLGTFPEA